MYWTNRYIFKRWTSQSFLCAQYISIWSPLAVWYTPRQNSVSREVLANISLVTDSVTQLSHSTIFHDKRCPLHAPKRKNSEESNLGNDWGGREWVPSSYPTISKLPIQKGTKTMGELGWCTTYWKPCFIFIANKTWHPIIKFPSVII